MSKFVDQYILKMGFLVPILVILSIFANASPILHSIIFLSDNTPEPWSDLLIVADEIA